MYRENLQPGERLILSRRGTIPRVLGSLLVGKLQTDYIRNGFVPEEHRFDSLLEFEIDFWRSNQSKVIITVESIRLFDAFLYDDFHDYLLSRIIYSKQGCGKEKDVI